MKDKKKVRSATTSFVDGQIKGECIYNPEDRKTQFVLRTLDTTAYRQQYTIGDYELVPPSQLKGLIQSQTLKLPSDVAEYGNVPELVAKVRAFINKYVDLSESFEIICTYYVLLTWLYDSFNELPYLRVRGDYGSGKTRFLSVLGALSYKPIFASGASTTAPLFHLLDEIKGTMIMDESDFRYSDTTAEITKILNNGNAKGFSVLRCTQSADGGYKATAYNIFGPKIIASRESFSDNALESRCITEDLGGKPLREDIPISLPDDFEAEALALRNQLLQYRFDHRLTSISKHTIDIQGLAGRTSQVYLPLLSLIQDPTEQAIVYQRIADYEIQLRTDRGLQTEAELLQVIHLLQEQNQTLSIATISKTFIRQFGDRYRRRITPKWIGYLLRSKLHLATRKAGGVYIVTEGQDEKLQRLMQTYDVI